MGLMNTYKHNVRLCVTIFFQRFTWTMMKNNCLAELRNMDCSRYIIYYREKHTAGKICGFRLNCFYVIVNK